MANCWAPGGGKEGQYPRRYGKKKSKKAALAENEAVRKEKAKKVQAEKEKEKARFAERNAAEEAKRVEALKAVEVKKKQDKEDAAVVEKAYQRCQNFDGLSFHYLVTGNRGHLSKMLKIAKHRKNRMSRFHNGE